MSIVVKVTLQEETRRLSVDPNISFEQFCLNFRNIEPNFDPSHQIFQYQDSEGDNVFITSTIELNEALSSSKNKTSSLKLTVIEKPKVTFSSNIVEPVVKTDLKESPFNLEKAIQALVDKVSSLAKNAEGVIPKVSQAIEPALQQAKSIGNDGYNSFSTAMKDPFGDVLRIISQKIEAAQPSSLPIHKVWCDNCKNQIVGIRYKCGHCADYDLCQICEMKQIHNPSHVFLKIKTPLNLDTKVLLPNFNPEPEKEKPLSTQPNVDVVSPAPSPSPSPSFTIVPIKPSKNLIQDSEIASLDATFIADETVQDGTVFTPGTKFVKIWVMQNTGRENWEQGTKLVLVNGNPLGTKGEIPVKSVKVGEKIDIFAEMEAPLTVGRHASHWRLATADGRKFGHRIWVEIHVENKLPQEPPKVLAKPLEEKYASTLASLAELGFCDKEKNVQLVEKFNGDLVKVINALVSV